MMKNNIVDHPNKKVIAKLDIADMANIVRNPKTYLPCK
jgi:hypothetical protein